MKIGVTTFLNTKTNYGQVLQAYALQRVLKNLGHEVYVVRENINGFPFLLRVKGWIQKCLSPREFLLNFKNSSHYTANAEPDRHFSDFIFNHIDVWPHIYTDANDMQCNAPEFDVMITGSDQVWNKYMTKEKHLFYLLQFGEKNCKRLSYAASFGRDSLYIHERDYFKKALSNFNLVSVREVTGKSICDNLGIEVKIVADPVVLLAKEDWMNIANEVGDGETDKNKAFAYMIANSDGESHNILPVVDQLKANGIDTTYVSASRFPDKLSNLWPSIPEWIRHINDSKIVITDSFHCTLFSIILNTPFIVIPREGRAGTMNNRITTLLDICGLRNRFVMDYREKVVEELLCSSIDWSEVNDRLSKYKNESLNILQSVL